MDEASPLSHHVDLDGTKPLSTPGWFLPHMVGPGGHVFNPTEHDVKAFGAVLTKLKKQYDFKPSAASFAKSIQSLNIDEKRVLAAQVKRLKELPSYEKKAFAAKASQELASEDGKQILAETAKAASEAFKDIKIQLSELEEELKVIDSEFAATGARVTPFEPKIKVIRQNYGVIMKDCKEISIRISDHIDHFSTLIVDFAHREGIEISKRKEVVEKYIAKADSFSSKADSITADLYRLQKDFNALVVSFRKLSNISHSPFGSNIEKIQKKLDELNQKLKNLEVSLKVVVTTAGALIPVTSALAGIFPMASVFIIGAGAIVGAAAAGSAAALAANIEIIKHDKANEEAKLKSLQTADAKYKAATVKLEQLNHDQVTRLAASIDLISKVLQNVKVDAVRVKDQLEWSESIIDAPDLMLDELKTASNIYESMAAYLELFSQSI